jgi:acyl-CoA synthetase (AMP-forming)/AMP-acid ligase II
MPNEPGPFTVKDVIFNKNQDPDHHAIESPGYRPLTYRDLREQVLSVVKTLNARGYHRNDRIAVIIPAGPEAAVITVSVMAGFTCIPLNHQYKVPEYEDFFSQLKVRAIIVQEESETDATRVAKARNIPVIQLTPVLGIAGKFELELHGAGDQKEAEFATPSDISNVFLTSGTTSRPKSVPVSQRQTYFIQQINCQTFRLNGADRCLHIVPYYHGLGIGPPLLSVLFAGGTVICTRDFIPSDFLHLLKTCRPTFYSAVPALHQGILHQIEKVPPEELKNNSLRFIRSGSAPLPANVRHKLEALVGVPVIEVFGMSEAGIISVNIPQRPGSVGIPVIECVKIVDENGDSLGQYEEGDIVIRGEVVFSGYEDAPDDNKAAFMDGGFRTGDIGYFDNDGYLYLTGRKKELINKGGRKIAPAEIDAVLKSHNGVRDAMAFSIADPVLGEDIAVMVVPECEPVSETELRRYLHDHLIQFKVPKKIYFVDEIPRNASGKPLRQAGTERYGRSL